MSYDAYDIKIWRFSILVILVFKEASGPQYSQPMISFWITIFGKIKKWKNMLKKISLYKFFKSFVFFNQILGTILSDFRDS
jgi:hypothetical protein